MSDMLPPLLLQVRALGHKVFDGPEPYDLNIIGIRSANPQPNKFDDLLCCAYREHIDGPFVIKYWAATTDPGTFCLRTQQSMEQKPEQLLLQKASTAAHTNWISIVGNTPLSVSGVGR